MRNWFVFTALLPLLAASSITFGVAKVAGSDANKRGFEALQNRGMVSFLEKEIPDFQLKNVDGRMVSTTDFAHSKGLIVVFTCNHCPFAKLYTQRFNDLNKKYAALGVPLLAINPMDTLVYEEETFELMQARARVENFNFPYLHDAEQSVGQLFDAEHTPKAFVLWKVHEKWIVKYSGAIDDNGQEPAKATPFIANAVDELLAGKPVLMPETESFGCRIFYRK